MLENGWHVSLRIQAAFVKLSACWCFSDERNSILPHGRACSVWQLHSGLSAWWAWLRHCSSQSWPWPRPNTPPQRHQSSPLDSMYSSKTCLSHLSLPLVLLSRALQNSISSTNLSWEINLMYISSWAALDTSVLSSSWSAKYSLALTCSKSWADTSWSMSAIRRLTEWSESGTESIFWAASSPSSSLTMSLVAGRIKSSPTVCSFLAWAMWYKPKTISSMPAWGQ